MRDATVAPCSFDAAAYAVTRWHYSKTMPAGKLVKHGVWEDGFVGAIVYGRGASNRLGEPYGLAQNELCELVRVALREHEAPVSQLVAESLRLLHESNPGLRLVVSFADEDQGHVGTIYQAGNWIYAGASVSREVELYGRPTHYRSIHARWGPGSQRIGWLQANVDPDARIVVRPPKHRYLMPLDRAMRRRLRREAKPYPRGRSLEGETSGSHPEGAGSTPAGRSVPPPTRKGTL